MRGGGLCVCPSVELLLIHLQLAFFMLMFNYITKNSLLSQWKTFSLFHFITAGRKDSFFFVVDGIGSRSVEVDGFVFAGLTLMGPVVSHWRFSFYHVQLSGSFSPEPAGKTAYLPLREKVWRHLLPKIIWLL